MKSRPTFLSSLIAFSLTLALAAVALAQAGRFAVQLEASPSRTEAEEKVSQLKAQGVQAYIVKSLLPGKGLFFRVRVGNFPARVAAERYGQQLKTQGTVRDFFIAVYETPDPEAPANVAKANPTPTPAAIKPPVIPAPINPSQPVVTIKEQPKTTTTTPPAMNKTAANSTAVKASATSPVTTPVSNPANSNASVIAGYTRYQDPAAGYSFEHPQYWVGGQFGSNEVQTQNVTAGAQFKSNEDAAFLNAIWNKLDKANSPDHDNDMIVDLILKSMGSGNGTQNMQALSRRVINEGAQIKTFLDLKATFQVPNQPAPLDFLGKGVIIRAAKGILLLVTFYSKDAPQTVAMVADHIVQTAKTPE
jgi:outer membrane biosynthesis protein TonB